MWWSELLTFFAQFTIIRQATTTWPPTFLLIFLLIAVRFHLGFRLVHAPSCDGTHTSSSIIITTMMVITIIIISSSTTNRLFNEQAKCNNMHGARVQVTTEKRIKMEANALNYVISNNQTSEQINKFVDVCFYLSNHHFLHSIESTRK